MLYNSSRGVLLAPALCYRRSREWEKLFRRPGTFPWGSCTHLPHTSFQDWYYPAGAGLPQQRRRVIDAERGWAIPQLSPTLAVGFCEKGFLQSS